MQTSPLGALLTFAQHKGYALATLCEVLGGALSAGKTTHQESLQTSVDAIFNCMTTVILRPDAFDAPDSQAQTEAFIAWCKKSPHDADAPVLAPRRMRPPTAKRGWRRGSRWMPAAGRQSAPPRPTSA